MKSLLPALNAAAEVMRQAAVSEAAVLQAVVDQLARLNLHGGISLFDAGNALTVRAVAFPTPAIAALEKLTGLKTIGYSFSPAQVDAYRQALETGQAVFVSDGSVVVAQLLPESARRSLDPIVRRLGRDPVIIAPLIAEGRRLGALSAVGPDLTADDPPAIMALANHTAIAIANARGREREAQQLRRLSAFNTVALALNNSTDLEEALRLTLRETLAALDLPAGWISLREAERTAEGNREAEGNAFGYRDRFRLAAHQNLPPALAADDYAAMRRQPCRCQRLLLAGQLPAAVNMLECERLLEWAAGDTRGLRVHAAIPIRSGAQILGMLNLALPPERASFDEDDLTMLTALGHQLGVTLARARLHAEMQESLHRERRLNEITRLTSGTLDEPTLLQTIVRLAAELIGAQVGAIALVSKDGQTITYPYLHNLPEGLALEPTPKGRGVAWRIVETGETILLDDYAHHPNALPQLVKAGVHAFIGVPILAGEARLGTLGLFNLDPARRFTERDAALAETVGRQAGVAIQNARLFKAKQWRVEALTALHQTGLDLSAQLDLPRLLRMITQRAAHLLDAPMGGLYLLLPDGETLELVVSHNLPRDYTGTRLRLGEGLSGRIAQTGEPLIVEDYSQWEGRAGIYADVPFAAVVGAPIKWQGKVIGVINVTDTQPGRFHAEDAQMLALFADQAAVAIANARLLEAERRRVATLTALHQTDLDMSAELNLPSLLRLIVERAARLLDAPSGGLYLMQPDGQTLELIVSYHRGRDFTGTRLRLGEGLSGRIAQTRQPMIVGDYKTWEGRAEAYADAYFRAIVGVPILWQNKVLGVLNVEDERPNRFGQADVDVLTLLAGQAAVAITNAQLYKRLESREAYFRALIESAWDGVMILDREGKFRYASPSVERILGYPPANLLGQNVFELIHPDDKALTAQALQEVVASGLVPSIEARLRHRNGFWRWLEATGRNLLQDPHVAGVLVNFRDITERKRAETALRRRTAELETLEQVASALRTASNRAEMLPVILDQILTVLNADGAALAVHDPVTKGAVIELARGAWAAWTGIRLAPGEGVSGYVIAARRPYVSDDVYTDPRMTHRDLIHDLRAVVCVPLIAHQQVIGALWAGRASGRRSGTGTLGPNPGFSEAEVHLLTAIADITANALRRETLHEQTERLAADLAQAYDTTLEGWAHALELRDEATEGHTRRVTDMTIELARAMGIHEDELIHIRRGALLHDIGKIGIPDSILLKPGELTTDEWKTMRQHPTYAHDMLSPVAFLRPALDIPYCHHERWDGTGYPRGLKGEQIPLAARIFAVVDVWDALTSDRPYRPAWPKEKALTYIREQTGKHFDPQVVEMFLKVLAEGKGAEAEGKAAEGTAFGQ